MGRFLHVLGIPLGFRAAFGSAFLAIMALTVVPLVLRFMRVASAELASEQIPICREVPAYLHNRVAMQRGYLDEIAQQFPGLVRGSIPLFETEVCGVPMLQRTARQLFGA